MEIQLLPPFSLKWRKGYIVINPENRRNVVLYNSNTDRTTVSYARYLVGVCLGHEVPEEYEVDHINNDKTDDRLDNYQLLTKEENRLKQQMLQSLLVVKWTMLPCSFCNTLFYITLNDLRFRKIETICCSKKCSVRFQFKRR